MRATTRRRGLLDVGGAVDIIVNIDTIGSDRGAVASPTSPTFYERLAKRGIPPLPFTEPAPELEQAEWLIGMWEESRRAFATATTPEMTRDAAA
ncbi:MAG: hypothetical protein ABR552_03860, partial [Actinomycetota bacterium]